MKLKVPKLNRRQMIVLLAMGFLFMIQSGTSEQLAPIGVSTVYITLTDASNGNPISGAQAILTCTDLNTMYGRQYTIITDPSGSGYSSVYPGHFSVKINKSGYETYSTSIFADSPNVYFVYGLTPLNGGGGTTPGSHDLIFYFVLSSNKRIQGAKIALGGQTYTSDGNGMTLIFGVKEGSYPAHVWGPSVTNGLTTDYDFTTNLIVGSSQSSYTYTIYCQSSMIKNEFPPSPQIEGFDALAWLMAESIIPGIQNWMLIAIGFAVLLILK